MLARRGTKEEHLRLADRAQLAVKQLSRDERLLQKSNSMLMHWDFNKRNIYVAANDPTHVTGIIDWQFTSIKPTFMYANDTPDFAELPYVSAAKDEEAPSNPPITATQDEESRRDSLICRKTFEVIVAAMLPKLAADRAMDDTMLRLFCYCRSSQTSGDLVLRHELLELSRLWQGLSMSDPCPYQRSEIGSPDHARQWDDFETMQQLKLFLMDKMDSSSEGWVSLEGCPSAKKANEVFFEQWMEVVRSSEDPDMNEVRGRELWPWREM